MHQTIGEIILDTSGVDTFVEMCKKRTTLNSDIEKLLVTSSYTKAITLMGENWGLPYRKQWIDYFSCGFQCSDNRVNMESMSLIQIQGMEHLKNARNNIDEVSNVKNKIVKSINTRQFVKVASQYIPSTVYEDELEVILLVFMPNAGGNKSIIIDVPFLAPYNEEEISRILAHELHHILRSKVEKKYLWKDEYYGVEEALYWFESEGIADLCNFEETAKMYSDFGYIKVGEIELILKNIDYYIKEINDLIVEILKGRKPSKELVEFLSVDVRFHVIGYFLAKTISNTFGNEVVGRVVGDPISFVNMYQKACEVNKNQSKYGFSEEMLRLLEDAYTK